MVSKILIANRGEIALRIVRACKELGIPCVAVHSTADDNAMHVRMADEAICIGPPQSATSYLSIPAIISACNVTKADAVHPGYGFLSENADFVQVLEDHDITFIGPRSEHINLMGNKIAAKQTMASLGIDCVPGSDGPVADASQAAKIAGDIGYPVLIKAAAGGGGRGIKIARSAGEIDQAFATAAAEAMVAFGDDALYVEKYLQRPRHIEIQVFGDGAGKAVHLGERDCSLQRRHQKVFEETPSPCINDDTRHEIGSRCAKAVAAISYSGAGTVEFLYEDGNFYFIEMNTRLQVEHPITESVYGVDLVHEQIRVAAGQPMSFVQEELCIRGHSIEVRINAESFPSFAACPGTVSAFHSPGGPGVRTDSALYSGYRIPPHYDSLIGKVIVHASDRRATLAKLNQALDELIVDGIDSTVELFQLLLNEPDILEGNYNIHWLEGWLSGK